MLHVHRAERADGLVEALRGLLAEPLADPFAPEVVAVPTRGMERWLTQRMSDRPRRDARPRDGVCANVEFPSPRRLVGDAVAAASGVDPDTDPWLPERAVWPLLEVVDEYARRAVAARPRRPPRRPADDADPAPARRFATRAPPRRAVRPLRAAPAGDGPRAGRAATTTTPGGGRAGRPSSGAGCASGSASPDPAERLEAACERLRARAGARSTCPPRLSLFGLTRLPAGHLRCCARSPPRRDVHLFLLHPVARAVGARSKRAGAAGRPPRRDDPTADAAATGCSPPGARTRARCSSCSAPREHVDHHHPVDAPAPTRCSRASRPTSAPTARRPAAAAGHPTRAELDPATAASRSTPATAAPARSRSLRDAILHLLEDDPTLEPRDVIVMCPDIETFAPLIQATFGAGEVGRRRRVDALPEARARPTCASASPTARCARPTRCSASSPQLIELAGAAADRLAGARPRRPRAGPPPLPARRRRPRAASRTGSPTAASAGGSTPRTARRSSSTSCRPAPGAPGSTACCVGVTMTEERPAAVRAACCRSTTSRAARSTSPAASPSSSTACRRRVDALRARRSRSASGRRRSPPPPTRSPPPRRATPGSARSCSGCSTTSSSEAGASSATELALPRCARCSPSGCRAARRARTSAPGT